MPIARTLKRLESWTSTAFLVAGALFLVALGLTVQELSTAAQAVSPFIAIGAFVATFVALFGMYSRLPGPNSTFAIAGVFTAALAVISVLSQLVYVVGSHLLLGTALQGRNSPPAATVLFLVILVSFGLSFLFYGIASLRNGDTPGMIGGLMLVIVLVWPGYAVLEQVLGLIDFNPIAIFFLVAFALLAIGHLLRTESVGPAQAEQKTFS